jgi:hypothetical protein
MQTRFFSFATRSGSAKSPDPLLGHTPSAAAAGRHPAPVRDHNFPFIDTDIFEGPVSLWRAEEPNRGSARRAGPELSSNILDIIEVTKMERRNSTIKGTCNFNIDA